jgi:hypothetical protein
VLFSADFYDSGHAPHGIDLSTAGWGIGVAGRELALSISRAHWGGTMPLARLMEDAIFDADRGTAGF